MEEFKQRIKSLSNRFESIRDGILTEEATKTSLIMPLIQALGYDVFNPNEFVPEYIADVGIKKGEKIDYAIMQEGIPVILIEAKSVHEKLEKHDSQLFRYFGTTRAKFAILTNGLEYKFFTDLEESNKMDVKPFFSFNIMEMRDNQVAELAKFRKAQFDVDHVLTTASELKYTGEVKQLLEQQWNNPSDEFIRFVLSEMYQGKKTQNVIEYFREIVKQSLEQFVNERVSDKLQKALNSTGANKETGEAKPDEVKDVEVSPVPEKEEVVTTEEEIEGYVHVKLFLKDVVESERIHYRDNKSYFNVLLDDNIRKWICRLGFNSNNKYITLNDGNKTTHKIERVEDLDAYKNEIVEVVKQFM